MLAVESIYLLSKVVFITLFLKQKQDKNFEQKSAFGTLWHFPFLYSQSYSMPFFYFFLEAINKGIEPSIAAVPATKSMFSAV